MLVKGESLASLSRLADVSINTAVRVLVDVGRACNRFHSETVLNVPVKRVKCDAVLSFLGRERENGEGKGGFGDIWTWVARDIDTKLVLLWHVADRSPVAADDFLLSVAGRLQDQARLTRDGSITYLDAVFNDAVPANEEGEYVSSGHIGYPHSIKGRDISHFPRLNKVLNKKIEKYNHATDLHFFYHNFVKQNRILSETPAMAAGLAGRAFSVEDIVNLTDGIQPNS